MSRNGRRIPYRLLDCREQGERANDSIRGIIRELARRNEQNPGVIYAKLALILDEVEASDQAWERLEFEMGEIVAQENGKK